MKIFLAHLLKLLFKIKPIRKRYYGIIKRVNASKIFKNITIQSVYDVDININLNLEDWIQQQIWFLGIYEPPQTHFFTKFIQPDFIFYDVGANIGYYTLLAAKRLDKGHVFAFEPDDKNRQLLIQNIRLNKFSNITIIDKIVSEINDKTIELYISDGNNSGMSSVYKPDNFSGKSEKKQTITLNYFCKTNPFPNIIKIDAEGSEPYILKGMNELLKDNNTVVLIELIEKNLKQQNHSIAQISEYFLQHNYFPFKICADSKIIPMSKIQEDSLVLFQAKMDSEN